MLEPAQCLVEDWDGWSESAPWPSRYLRPFIDAGPIVAAIAGAGVGGAVRGITGVLNWNGNPGI